MMATARLDRRTKNLTKRLKAGDIAIIDHTDLDRVAADALIRSQVTAVVNVAPSASAAGTRTRARRCSWTPAFRWSTTSDRTYSTW